MSIDSGIEQILFDLTLALSKEAAIQAHEYLKSHGEPRGYLKYPVRSNIFPKDRPEYEELSQKIPYLKHDIQRYELKDFPKDRIHSNAHTRMGVRLAYRITY